MTVLITGVGKGIGRALCEKFLSGGHSVVGTYYSTPKPDYSSPQLTLVPLDLSNDQSVAEAAKEIEKLGMKFDILVNNAGALFDEEETRVVVDKLRKTLEVNLIGTINFTEQVLPLIKDGGHIVNISSSAGSLTNSMKGVSHFPDHYPAYKISKAGLNMYTVTLARALREQNVTVSSVHPGWVKTDMGGQEADITPEQAAEDIYKFALTRPESGRFWYKNEPMPW
ncbi:MAG TPA: SDR family NAD(P)-dependent oxidoreductase [Candidatus Paceibacterota bacterium]